MPRRPASLPSWAGWLRLQDHPAVGRVREAGGQTSPAPLVQPGDIIIRPETQVARAFSILGWVLRAREGQQRHRRAQRVCHPCPEPTGEPPRRAGGGSGLRRCLIQQLERPCVPLDSLHSAAPACVPRSDPLGPGHRTGVKVLSCTRPTFPGFAHPVLTPGTFISPTS